MAATSSTASTATWGVTTITGEIASISGVITDFTKTTELVETSDVSNELGLAVQRKAIEHHTTIDATIICKNSAALPKTGDEITIGQDKYMLLNIHKTESNDAWTSIAIKADRYNHCDKMTSSITELS